ncbi:MAG: hypothetical protein HUK25_03380 [Treponema sp.]|nr:hypothetical protein [Treponema sp.]
MKKIIALVSVLFILGAFCFFRCWTQIKVKSNHCGVVVSRLHGIKKEPVVKGKFSFSPEFLIPKNASLVKFSLKPVVKYKKIEGELPSAEIYSMGGTFDFKYSFDFTIEFHPTPNGVVSLMEKGTVTDSKDLDSYLSSVSDLIASDASAFYLQKAINDSHFIPESVTIVDIFKECKFYERYPEIEIDVIALTRAKIPDYELYEKYRGKILSEIGMKSYTDIVKETNKAISDSNPTEQKSSESVDSEEGE